MVGDQIWWMVVQTAELLIIGPIFEAGFMDCSHGFRPRRSALGAPGEASKYLNQGPQALHDAGLKGTFYSIPHDKQINILRMRIDQCSMFSAKNSRSQWIYSYVKAVS